MPEKSGNKCLKNFFIKFYWKNALVYLNFVTFVCLNGGKPSLFIIFKDL